MVLLYSPQRKGIPHNAGILDVPVEIIIEILKYLEYRDLLRCQAVSRILHDTIRDSLELQYVIELGADNLVDGSREPGSINIAERLELLLERRRRWRELNWKAVDTVKLGGQCQAYEFVGGSFAMSTGGPNGMLASSNFVVNALPSRFTQGSSIVREDIGVLMKDFAIDPSQDLIALVEQDEFTANVPVKVHLRTISTNKAHPAATHAVLTAPALWLPGVCFVRIVEDVVGLFFWLQNPGLIIWDWHTADMIVFRSGVELPIGTYDFAFLSARTFFVTSTDGDGSIELFTFESTSQPEPPTHMATLRLPSLQEGMKVITFSTHSAPWLGGPTRKGVPFTTAQDDRIHVMSLTYRSQHGPKFHMFVKNSFMQRIVSEVAADSDGAELQRKVLEWNEWGPKHTRLFEHNVQFQWLRYVHGQRVILPPTPASLNPMDETMRVFVMDFNPHSKRVHDPADDLPAEVHPYDWDYYVQSSASVIDAGPLFRSDVITKLPYAFSSRAGKLRYTGLMIDDERIVGIKDSAFASSSLSEIDVFEF